MIKPLNRQLAEKNPTIAYNCEVSPYDDNCFMSMEDKSPSNILNPEALSAYADMVAFARKSLDEILPKYFPKDAKYLSSSQYDNE